MFYAFSYYLFNFGYHLRVYSALGLGVYHWSTVFWRDCYAYYSFALDVAPLQISILPPTHKPIHPPFHTFLIPTLRFPHHFLIPAHLRLDKAGTSSSIFPKPKSKEATKRSLNDGKGVEFTTKTWDPRHPKEKTQTFACQLATGTANNPPYCTVPSLCFLSFFSLAPISFIPLSALRSKLSYACTFLLFLFYFFVFW